MYGLAAGIGPECVYVLLLESGTGMYGFLPLVSGAEMCSVTAGIWDRNGQFWGGLK